MNKLNQKHSGFTVIEVIMIVGLVSVISLGLMTAVRSANRAYLEMIEQGDLFDIKMQIFTTIDCKETGALLPTVAAVKSCNPANLQIDLVRKKNGVNEVFVVKPTSNTGPFTTMGKFHVRAKCSNAEGANASNGFRVDVEVKKISKTNWKSVFNANQQLISCSL